ncbi:MAG TPA: TSUP family transporter [Dermatophilaceae bacterium]|nr:TSUP family transporter [Dermatophilaceae bacterium]
MTADLVLLPLGVVAGAVTQRVTGIGFALVSAPLLVLVAGPFDGIILSNILGLLVSAVVLASTWRHAQWRRGALLALPALAAIPLGALVARRVPGPVLLVLIGSLVLVALALVQLSPRARILRGRRGAVAAGAASGFMNVTAGVGGPAIVLYAVSTAWEHRRFVATFQYYSVMVNLASLLVKGAPSLPGSALLVSVAALAVGLAGGEVLSRRVSPERASRAVLVLATAGALSTVVKGVVSW